MRGSNHSASPRPTRVKVPLGTTESGNAVPALGPLVDQELARRSGPAVLSYGALFIILGLATSLPQSEPIVFMAFIGIGLPIALMRALLSVRFPDLQARSPVLARRLFIAGLLSMATLWGAACAVIAVRHGLDGAGVVMIVCTCSLLAAGTSTLAIDGFAHAWFIALTALPLIGGLLAEPTSERVAISILCILMMSFLLVEARLLRQQWKRGVLDRLAIERASETKSRFLANVSHELRTPLTGVIGYSQLLAQRHPRVDQADSIQGIRVSAETLLRVVNDLLDMAKVEAGRLELRSEPVHIREVVDKAVRAVRPRAEDKSLPIEVAFDADVPFAICGDGGRIAQILMNLLSNAVKFTRRGHVRVNVAATHRGRSSTELAITVTDTGIGVPADRQDAIFQAFTQAHLDAASIAQGTGLGLTICTLLVRLMGGHMSLQSTEGEGSCFGVYLPVDILQDQMPPSLPIVEVAPPPPSRRARILLAEDQAMCAKATQGLLSGRGYTVDVVADGQAAAKAATKRDVVYDLVLMDVNMPIMDGVEATQMIRRLELGLNRRVPIVALTADTTRENRTRCELAGMDRFLVKPIRIEDLERALDSVLCPDGVLTGGVVRTQHSPGTCYLRNVRAYQKRCCPSLPMVKGRSSLRLPSSTSQYRPLRSAAFTRWGRSLARKRSASAH